MPTKASKDLKQLDVRNRERWREWLQKNHATSPGVWLVYHKQHSGVASIDYDDSVCEALCFGWVDSLIRRLDATRYARKFTPRTSSSAWSESNRKRWNDLRKVGLLAPAGLALSPAGKRMAQPPPTPAQIPSYITAALKKNAKAWSAFQKLAPSHRREYVMWIHMAKRPETRERRLREAIRLLSAGKKLGLK